MWTYHYNNHNNYHNNDNQITRVAHEYQYTPNLLLPLVKVSLGLFCSYSNSFCRLMALDGVHWYWYWYVLMLGAWSAHQPLRTASEIDTHSTYSTHSTHRVAQGEDVWSAHLPLRTASKINTHSTYSTHSTHRLAQSLSRGGCLVSTPAPTDCVQDRHSLHVLLSIRSLHSPPGSRGGCLVSTPAPTDCVQE